MKFTISRSKWLRGQGSICSFLFRGIDNKMCCVGFFCRAYGLSEDEIENKKTVIDLDRSIQEKLPDWTWEDTKPFKSHTITDIYYTNDSNKLSEPGREIAITALFASKGITVEFID